MQGWERGRLSARQLEDGLCTYLEPFDAFGRLAIGLVKLLPDPGEKPLRIAVLEAARCNHHLLVQAQHLPPRRRCHQSQSAAAHLGARLVDRKASISLLFQAFYYFCFLFYGHMAAEGVLRSVCAAVKQLEAHWWCKRREGAAPHSFWHKKTEAHVLYKK